MRKLENCTLWCKDFTCSEYIDYSFQCKIDFFATLWVFCWQNICKFTVEGDKSLEISNSLTEETSFKNSLSHLFEQKKKDKLQIYSPSPIFVMVLFYHNLHILRTKAYIFLYLSNKKNQLVLNFMVIFVLKKRHVKIKSNYSMAILSMCMYNSSKLRRVFPQLSR